MMAYINYKFSSLNYLNAKSFERCHFSHDNPTAGHTSTASEGSSWGPPNTSWIVAGQVLVGADVS